MTAPAPTILVGVDGSEQSRLAVDWAAAEAIALGVDLTVCNANILGADLDADPHSPYGEALTLAREIVHDAADRAQRAWPRLGVISRITAGGPEHGLCREAEHARLLVVGNHGVDFFTGLLLGSVSAYVAAHAPCPAVVVHGDGRHTAGRPVVVGVANDGSEAALAFGFDFAARHQRPLIATHAFRLPPPDPRVHPSLGAPGHSYGRAAAQLLEGATARLQEKYPDVPVELRPLDYRATRGLLALSAEAGLLVLATHWRHPTLGYALGSVAQHVLRHAACPVAVVH
jgi:nucleotide-binding universal stress UspA family protein